MFAGDGGMGEQCHKRRVQVGLGHRVQVERRLRVFGFRLAAVEGGFVGQRASGDLDRRPLADLHPHHAVVVDHADPRAG